MNLTPKLKSWSIKNLDIDADSSDKVFQKAVADALVSGDLHVDKFKELSLTAEDQRAADFDNRLKGLGDIMDQVKGLLSEKAAAKPPGGEVDPTDMPKTDVVNEENEDAEIDDYTNAQNPAKKKAKPPKMDDGKDEEAEEEAEGEKATDDEGGEKVKKATPASVKGAQATGTKGNGGTKMGGLDKIMRSLSTPYGGDNGDGEKSLSIRVKEAADQYSTTKSAMIYPSQTLQGKSHPLAGQPVKDFSDAKSAGRVIDNPSERDKAICGAYCKFTAQVAILKSRELAFRSLPQHDKELVLYALENEKWGGSSDGGDYADIKDARLTPSQQKALIDDSTSGGINAAPIVFDDQVISYPLLNGELFPLVTQVPLDRGRRVEGVATQVVTAGWGGVDDTSVTLFNTTNYISAFDTTIFRWQGAFRIGLDFLSDTPIDFGQYVTLQYGERLLKDLDDVIATGDGTTQPEGVMVHSGTTSVNWGGVTSIGNYESMRFGVPKQEHRANLMSSAVFCGTETSYQRALAIPVGASDARRLSNTVNMPNYDGYQWMQRPYKINSSLSNSQIFYAILARYRMYRRRGFTMRTSTEGDTLIRANEMLLVAMARYGGQIERGAVACVTTTAPA